MGCVDLFLHENLRALRGKGACNGGMYGWIADADTNRPNPCLHPPLLDCDGALYLLTKAIPSPEFIL